MAITSLHCDTVRGGGPDREQWPLLHSADFQSLPPLLTIKLGHSGAASWVGGLVHSLGPRVSLQWPLLWGWEFLLLLPQPSQVFSISSLRLEPWVTWCASLLWRSSQFICERMWGCGAIGPKPIAVALPAPFAPQSATSLGPSTSCHLASSPVCPGCPSLPLLPV